MSAVQAHQTDAGLDPLALPKRLGYSIVIVKVRDVLKMLAADGWKQTSQVGSHRQFEHPIKPGKVTVPGQPGDDIPIGTLKSIRRQAGL